MLKDKTNYKMLSWETWNKLFTIHLYSNNLLTGSTTNT